MGLLTVLQRCNPEHSALLGPWRDLLEAAGFQPLAKLSEQPSVNALEQEVLDLNADAFNLLAYLSCAHHGKVRLAWHAGPSDQAANDQQLRIMGVKNGDPVPLVPLTDNAGATHELP
ncbi:hypothetical protein JZU51_01050, partial [bacterium]|nr:hypothetical protein [bacterium]